MVAFFWDDSFATVYGNRHRLDFSGQEFTGQESFFCFSASDHDVIGWILRHPLLGTFGMAFHKYCSAYCCHYLLLIFDKKMLHTFKVTLAKCLLMMTSFVLITIAHAGGSYDLGVYYYPGWKFNEVGNWIKEPWSKIKPYPYLEPLIGWYDESDPSVIAMQTKWMREYGINYIIFDWYWGPYLASRHEHALRNYLALKDKSSIDFAIMWANHDESPKSFDEFKSAVNYWIDNYFSHKEYKKIDGEPVVYFFSANLLEEKARKFGATTAVLLSEANRIATSRGLKGIKFVGGVGAYDKYFSKGGSE